MRPEKIDAHGALEIMLVDANGTKIECESEMCSRERKCELLERKYPYLKDILTNNGFTFFTFCSHPKELDKEQNFQHIDFKPR